MERKFTRLSAFCHKKLPLVTTTYFTQLLEAFDNSKIDYKQHLKAFNLSENIISSDGHLPAHQFLSFVQCVLKKSNTLGFDQLIHCTPEQLLRLGTKQRPRSLLSLIDSITRIYEIHTDLIRLRIWEEPDESLWLGMQQHPSIKVDLLLPFINVHLFSLIQIIRYAEADDWLPTEIILPVEKQKLCFLPFGLEYCRTHFQEDLIGIKIKPTYLEKRPENFLHTIRKIGKINSRIGELPLRRKTDAVPSIEFILLTYLKTTQSAPGYHLMAEMNGISERSLNRKLNIEGENYRSLVRKVRIHLSMMYLRDSDAKIETIANSLGYPRCSSFVRSFKRLTGRSPTDFRKNRT